MGFFGFSSVVGRRTLSFSAARRILAERFHRVQYRLRQEGLAVGLAYATEHMPGDVQYLTGYDPHLENAALLVLPNHPVILGGVDYVDQTQD